MKKYKRKFQEVSPAMGALYFSQAHRDRKDFFGANVLKGSFGAIMANTLQDLIDEFSSIDLQFTVVGSKTDKWLDTLNIFVGNKIVGAIKITMSSNTSASKIEKEIRKRIAKYI